MPGLIQLLVAEFSYSQPYKEYTSDCNYCRRPRNNGRVAYGAHYHAITPQDCDCLLEDGWIRSGSHVYAPSNEKACCPNIPIRLDVLAFEPTRDQKRTLKRISEYLDGTRPIVLPQEEDVLERSLVLAEQGDWRAAAELSCLDRARGEPLSDEETEEKPSAREALGSRATRATDFVSAHSFGSCPPTPQAGAASSSPAASALGSNPETCASFRSAAAPAQRSSDALDGGQDGAEVTLKYCQAVVEKVLSTLLSDPQQLVRLGLEPAVAAAALPRVLVSHPKPLSRRASSGVAQQADTTSNAAFVLAAAAAAPAAPREASKGSLPAVAAPRELLLSQLASFICAAIDAMAPGLPVPVVARSDGHGPGHVNLYLSDGGPSGPGAISDMRKYVAEAEAALASSRQPPLPVAPAAESGEATVVGRRPRRSSLASAAHDRESVESIERAMAALPTVTAQLPVVEGKVVSCLTAHSPQEWRELRRHYARVQASRELVGLELLRTSTDQPPLEGEDDESEEEPEEEEGEDSLPPGAEQSTTAAAAGDTSMMADSGAGSSGSVPPHRNTSGGVAAVSAVGESRRKARLEKDIEDSIQALRDYIKEGVGNYARLLRQQALDFRYLTAPPPPPASSAPPAGSGVGFAASGGTQQALAALPASPALSAVSSPALGEPLLPFGRGRHRLVVELVRPTYSAEANELYVRFNMALHRGRPRDNTPASFTRHLVSSPLIRTPAHYYGYLWRAANGLPPLPTAAASSSSAAPSASERHATQVLRGRGAWTADTLHALSAGLGVEALAPCDLNEEVLGSLASSDETVAWLVSALKRVRWDQLGEGFPAVSVGFSSGFGTGLWDSVWGSPAFGAEREPTAFLAPLPLAFAGMLVEAVETASQLGVPLLGVVLAMFNVTAVAVRSATALLLRVRDTERLRAEAERHNAAKRAEFAVTIALRRAEEAELVAVAAATAAPSGEDRAPSQAFDASFTNQGGGDGGKRMKLEERVHSHGAPASGPEPFALSGGAPEPTVPGLVPVPDLVTLPPTLFSEESAVQAVRDFCAQHVEQLWWLREAVVDTITGVVNMVDSYGDQGQQQRRDTPVRTTPASGAYFDKYLKRAAAAGGAAQQTPFTASAEAAVAKGGAAAGAALPPRSAARQWGVASGSGPPGDDCRIEVSGWDLSLGYGSFHHEYRLDGKLIAVSVLDILPTRVVSIYFFYSPSFRYMELGKLSAQVEIWLTQQMNMHCRENPSVLGLPPGVGPLCRHWDPNLYVHAVHTMNYKRHFHPSELLCPVARRGHWVSITPEVLLKLDADLAAPLATVDVQAVVDAEQAPFPSLADGGGDDATAAVTHSSAGPAADQHQLQDEAGGELLLPPAKSSGANDGDVMYRTDGDGASLVGASSGLTPRAPLPTSAPEAVRAYNATESRRAAELAEDTLPTVLISLREHTEVLPYAGLSAASHQMLHRGMLQFMRRAGPVCTRTVIDPMGIASVESRYTRHQEEKRAAKEARLLVAEARARLQAEQEQEQQQQLLLQRELRASADEPLHHDQGLGDAARATDVEMGVTPFS